MASYVDAVEWSQTHWQNFARINFAGRITQPALIIVDQNAFTRARDEEMYGSLGSKVKRLHVTPEATHFSVYDQDPYVNENLEISVAFLEEDL